MLIASCCKLRLLSIWFSYLLRRTEKPSTVNTKNCIFSKRSREKKLLPVFLAMFLVAFTRGAWIFFITFFRFIASFLRSVYASFEPFETEFGRVVPLLALDEVALHTLFIWEGRHKLVAWAVPFWVVDSVNDTKSMVGGPLRMFLALSFSILQWKRRPRATRGTTCSN